jgi:phosphatidate cytidylyltransferase
VADIDPVSGPGEGGRPVPMVASNLTLRIASAAVMAPLALLTAYLGGWIFTLFWAVAAIAVLWEWVSLVTGPVWIIVGIAYAGTLWLAPMLLRADAADGFFAIVLLFAIVWTTDVLGYFVGRAIGGPKLMPAVSPKKTWSGAIAGALGAMIVGGLVAKSFELVDGTAVAVIALLLSMVAQLGDLFESWIKRKFGAKDASHLIPGHGGVMDRLDGFWAAALVGCLIGLLRGGVDGVATGLLVW